MKAHADQKRKYTNNPYFEHLAEVAGMLAFTNDANIISMGYLHDVLEDTNYFHNHTHLVEETNYDVGLGVVALTEIIEGTRKERKIRYNLQLANAPFEVRVVKLADMISNTQSIMIHDKKFAMTYVQEKKDTLKCFNEKCTLDQYHKNYEFYYFLEKILLNILKQF